MQLYFIRHGQSTNNALWDQTGASKGRSEDPELTDIGREQAQRLAAFMRASRHEFGLTHLYTSLMVRSIETALEVGTALDLPGAAWEDLHETGGIFQEADDGDAIGLPGKARRDFERAYPSLRLHETLNAHGWWNRPFEAPEVRPARAQRFLRDLLARHGDGDDRVAVVSHGNFYRYLLAAILRIPDPDAVFFDLSNTAISRIVFPRSDDEVTRITYLNRADFLPPDLRT
jgi:2,3-bisphosphoglycerate-dependent phosphoglycerate mutase